MAKTWDIESGMGRALALVQALCRKVRQHGGTEDDVRRLLGEEREGLLDQLAKLIVGDQKAAGTATPLIFELSINCDQPLADMIAAGHYDSVNTDITAEHFPITGQGQLPIEVELHHFNCRMPSEQALQELDQAGYRPGVIEELLALGTKNPELQRQFPIIALASRWRYSRGHRDVPSLHGWYGRRELDLLWFGDDWYEHCRFLAVRK